jgi:hypothetical protein
MKNKAVPFLKFLLMTFCIAGLAISAPAENTKKVENIFCFARKIYGR